VRVTKLLILVCCLGLSGCSVVDFLTPEPAPYNEEVSAGYYQTNLKTSTASDVLGIIQLPEYETLSQSKSVVASVGQKKKGYKMWLKIVAFDENNTTAKRKYLFIEDEKPKILFVEPWTYVSFDCQMVLEPEVLNKPYADENAKQIAILKQILESTRKDMDQVRQDNKKIAVSGMMINQGLESALVELDHSPGLAKELNNPDGIEFSHISLDKGKIHMAVEGDVATVKMRLGSQVKKLVGREM